jgi:hypothetical protein
MDSGTKTQTNTTSSEPWSPAQPALKTGLADAESLYSRGIGGEYYGGNTAIPFDANTQKGMDYLGGMARQNLQGDGVTGRYQTAIWNGGFNAPQMDAVSNLTKVANAAPDIYGDPAYMQVRDRVAADTTQGVNLGAASAGRYGSGAHTDVLQRSLSDSLAGMDVSQLQRQQGRQDAATQNLFNAGQQGFSNLGTAYQGMKAPTQDLMGIGTMYEDLAGRNKNDEIRLFQESQDAPWNAITRLNAVAGGAGSMGGTSNATAQTPGQNPFATGLGYASSGIGILGGMKNLGMF